MRWPMPIVAETQLVAEEIGGSVDIGDEQDGRIAVEFRHWGIIAVAVRGECVV